MNDLLQSLITGVVPPLLGILASALLGVGGLAVHRLADFLKLQSDSKVRESLLAAVNVIVDGIERKLVALVPGGPPLAPAAAASVVGQQSVIAAQLVGAGANYLAERYPDALKRLGVGDVGLRDIIDARLQARGLPSGG